MKKTNRTDDKYILCLFDHFVLQNIKGDGFEGGCFSGLKLVEVY